MLDFGQALYYIGDVTLLERIGEDTVEVRGRVDDVAEFLAQHAGKSASAIIPPRGAGAATHCYSGHYFLSGGVLFGATASLRETNAAAYADGFSRYVALRGAVVSATYEMVAGYSVPGAIVSAELVRVCSCTAPQGYAGARMAACYVEVPNVSAGTTAAFAGHVVCSASVESNVHRGGGALTAHAAKGAISSCSPGAAASCGHSARHAYSGAEYAARSCALGIVASASISSEDRVRAAAAHGLYCGTIRSVYAGG